MFKKFQIYKHMFVTHMFVLIIRKILTKY